VDHRFQVNLRGVIELLSHHLYSTPGVFVRELLQNATDAIRARQHLEPGHPGTVRVELIEKQDGGLPTLLFSDDGVGLTEEELHRFLATIGESSKRETLETRRNDFIGQFGIGLLSCFMVCDELLVVTRSAKGDGTTMEWRGRHDGTYAVRASEHPLERPGTQVFLVARQDAAEFFTPERVRQLAQHVLSDGGQTLDAFAHVCDAAGEINPDASAWSDHAASARRIKRTSSASDSSMLALRVRPLPRRISMRG